MLRAVTSSLVSAPVLLMVTLKLPQLPCFTLSPPSRRRRSTLRSWRIAIIASLGGRVVSSAKSIATWVSSTCAVVTWVTYTIFEVHPDLWDYAVVRALLKLPYVFAFKSVSNIVDCLDSYHRNGNHRFFGYPLSSLVASDLPLNVAPLQTCVPTSLVQVPFPTL